MEWTDGAAGRMERADPWRKHLRRNTNPQQMFVLPMIDSVLDQL